jgi:hypothetical protein
MKKEEAKSQAYIVWLGWDGRKEKNNMLGLTFYTYLQSTHAHLLTFRTNGDPYQVVNSWVIEWQRLDDAN